VEPFQGSLVGSTLTQGGAAAPLTLGYDVKPLRGIETQEAVEPCQFSPAQLVVHDHELGEVKPW